MRSEVAPPLNPSYVRYFSKFFFGNLLASKREREKDPIVKLLLERWTCPITKEPVRPCRAVRAPDDHIYDEAAARKWVEQKGGQWSSPITREVAPCPNFACLRKPNPLDKGVFEIVDKRHVNWMRRLFGPNGCLKELDGEVSHAMQEAIATHMTVTEIELDRLSDEMVHELFTHGDEASYFPQLEYLSITESKVNNRGCATLGRACSNGTMPNLSKRRLADNQLGIGNTGMIKFFEALASGVLPKLKKLFLYNNQIGDAGMIKFSDACVGGALAQCETLNLCDNKIGDKGLEALAGALGKGRWRSAGSSGWVSIRSAILA